MAYTPIGWVTGDTITADKLNKMDNGWSVTESRTTLCNESITTTDTGRGYSAGTLAYNTQITADSITVTFEGTEYECPLVSSFFGMNNYGGVAGMGYDFTTYPFAVVSSSNSTDIITESAGTYSIKIETVTRTGEVSTNFSVAVNTVNIPLLPMLCVSGTTTYDEISAAVEAKKFLYFWSENYGCFIITNPDVSPFEILGFQSNNVSADYDENDIFVVTES